MTNLTSISFLFIGIFSCLMTLNAFGQCATFSNAEGGAEAKEAHVIYRDFLKSGEFDKAYEYWKKAYEIAPAADGNRTVQYTDGVKLLMNKYKKATDDTEKTALRDQILALYDAIPECYPDDKAFALGRKVYSMYYDFNMYRDEIYKVGKMAIEAGGMNTEYVALPPTADGLVSEWKAGNVEVDEARRIFKKIQDILDHNIANNQRLKAQYEQTKQNVDGTLRVIEPEVFDCQYFKDKYMDEYQADPDNPDVYREVYKKLVQGGCDKEDPFMKEISEKDKAYIAAEKARLLKEKQENNPGWYASQLYKDGAYDMAIDKYQEAIEQETDPEQQASYYFSMASIQFRKLKQYSTARANARKAASLKDNWGRPYMLIGDMYASTASSCGDSWNQRLAILAAVDKYSYAKSIDGEVAEEASEKIGRYRSSYPEQQEGFMRGVKAGQSATVGCWIGESVSVRFK